MPDNICAKRFTLKTCTFLLSLLLSLSPSSFKIFKAYFLSPQYYNLHLSSHVNVSVSLFLFVALSKSPLVCVCKVGYHSFITTAVAGGGRGGDVDVGADGSAWRRGAQRGAEFVSGRSLHPGPSLPHIRESDIALH